MRVTQTGVAILATAVLVLGATAPVMAKSKPQPRPDFFEGLSNFFSGEGFEKGPRKPGGSYGGGSYGGGGGGEGGYNGGGFGFFSGHVKKDYTDIPGTPGTPATKATDTIVYFGTCKNLAGIQQAGNADEDGFCLPFESLVGSEASSGTPGSGPSCAVTTSTKSWSQPSESARGFNGGGYGGTWTQTTTIVSGTCDSVKAAEPPKYEPSSPPYGDQ
jgi:hypothetical protein